MVEILDLGTNKFVSSETYLPTDPIGLVTSKFSQLDRGTALSSLIDYTCFLTQDEFNWLTGLFATSYDRESPLTDSLLLRSQYNVAQQYSSSCGSEFRHFRDILIDIHSKVADGGNDSSVGTHSRNILIDNENFTLKFCDRGLDNLGDWGHWVGIMDRIMRPDNLLDTLTSQITLSATDDSYSISLCSPLEGGLHIDYSENGKQVAHLTPSSDPLGLDSPFLILLANAKDIKPCDKSVTELGKEAGIVPADLDCSSTHSGQDPERS